MGVYQRNGRWIVYYWENGKRRDRSFGRGDEGHSAAVVFDESFKSARDSGTFFDFNNGAAEISQVNLPVQNSLPVEPVSTGIGLLELTEKFLEHLKASGRSEVHIKNIDLHVKKQFMPVLGDKPVDRMTYPDDILPFIRHFQGVSSRTGKARSQTTVNRYTDYLNAVFSFGIEMGLTTVNPMKGRRKSKERPREVQISVDDVKRIMAAADDHLRWAMEVCFSLGLRPGKSELFAVRYDQINWETNSIKVFASKTQTYRTIPFSDSFAERLKEMEGKSLSGYLIEYHGKPVTRINKAFQAACVRAGITVPTRMYDLRHLFATTMLSKGADLAAVSKLMGHSRVTMTADTYYQYLQGEKERAVNLLPQLAV